MKLKKERAEELLFQVQSQIASLQKEIKDLKEQMELLRCAEIYLKLLAKGIENPSQRKKGYGEYD